MKLLNYYLLLVLKTFCGHIYSSNNSSYFTTHYRKNVKLINIKYAYYNIGQLQKLNLLTINIQRSICNYCDQYNKYLL